MSATNYCKKLESWIRNQNDRPKQRRLHSKIPQKYVIIYSKIYNDQSQQSGGGHIDFTSADRLTRKTRDYCLVIL